MVRIFRDKKGYKRFSGSRKLVHRWVAKKNLGRPFRRGEEVHHRDGDRGNFRSSNLKVYPNRKTHLRREHPQKRKKRGWRQW